MPLATTKIWPVRDSLRRVVDYAANPDKTEYSGLAQALHYAENDSKTTLQETAQLVSGVHCRPETAWAEMRAVQEQFGKTEGVVAMHAYQSFKPGEVTPEQCHAIGVELARRVWGGRFQVLVATHLNTGCLHNHFVINAVSYVDGKKYEQRRSQYQDLRRISDQLCREYALSKPALAQARANSAPSTGHWMMKFCPGWTLTPTFTAKSAYFCISCLFMAALSFWRNFSAQFCSIGRKTQKQPGQDTALPG